MPASRVAAARAVWGAGPGAVNRYCGEVVARVIAESRARQRELKREILAELMAETWS